MVSMKILGASALALCAWLAACSGEDDADDDAGSSSSGGTSADGGSSSGGSSGGSSSGGAACNVLGSNVLADEPKQLSGLALAGNALVFVSDDAAPAIPPTIEKIGADGSGRTTLHVPTGLRRIVDTRAFGDKVFFLEEDTADAVPATELWSVPVAGGAAVQVGATSFPAGRIFGVDATHVYIAQNTDSPVGSIYDRVEIATGTSVRLATSLPNTGTPSQISISGNDVFYMAGKTGAQAGSHDLYRFDKSLAAQTPTPVLPTGLADLCDIALGGIYATPTKLACGFSALRAGNRDGTGITELIAKDVLKPASNILVGSDAELFYLHDSTGQQTKTSALRRIASSGGELTTIACDLGRIQNRLLRTFFPIQTEYEVIVGATDVFWIEVSGTDSDPKWMIRHATK